MSAGLITEVGTHAQNLAKAAVEFNLHPEEVEHEVVRRMMVEVMEKYCGNQCRAAKRLGWHRNTFGRWMKALNISPRLGKGRAIQTALKLETEES